VQPRAHDLGRSGLQHGRDAGAERTGRHLGSCRLFPLIISSAAPTAISRGKCFFSVPSSNGLPVCGFTTNWQIIACGTPKPTRILTLLRCSGVATKDFRPQRPGFPDIAPVPFFLTRIKCGRIQLAHAFDGSERLGLRKVTSFVAQSPTPSDHCVRFASAVADDCATLASRRLHLPPAGSRVRTRHPGARPRARGGRCGRRRGSRQRRSAERRHGSYPSPRARRTGTMLHIPNAINTAKILSTRVHLRQSAFRSFIPSSQ
jgi:hypothetical protein